jgi:hypothetical protein
MLRERKHRTFILFLVEILWTELSVILGKKVEDN